ncbi:hypothetical protein OGAPHI_004518 [Ogataea philodendri]|uniref:Uncharacterized protein n=1 Tax=Ogataea philodendri TaxID=1378263 RepID=A0A9P8P7Y0_9ASCO|nr:uncharacterized protein OGAPHI_004518 [Ogataea philodendri]KAH3666329.1 hypothetical protein OGAPHI_004518 [Ogataea philodendri]
MRAIPKPIRKHHDSLNVVDFPIDHNQRNDDLEDGTNELATENGPWRHFGVVSNLLVVDILLGLSSDVVSKCLQEHQGVSVTGDSVSNNQLDKNLQREVITSNGVDNT